MKFRIIRSVVFILFISTISSNGQTTSRQNTTSMANSETRDAKAIAKKFETELQRYRDIAPLVKIFFVQDFLGRFEKENDGFPLAFFKPGVASQISKDDRLRYYNLSINSYYLSLQYSSSKWLLSEVSDEPKPQDMVPPGVYEIFSNNPLMLATINQDSNGDLQIQSKEELHAILPTLEKAVGAMQRYLKIHPPEQTRNYKKNISDLKKNDSIMKPWVSICDKPCYGFPLETRLVSINIPFLQLLLVKDRGSLKILSVAPYGK